ncbi:MAG: permease prefix domain 1-containing protein [Micromonosporaceae bacterium]
MISTLTDRYVWAVVRSLPEQKRADVERELRGLIGDAAEARAENGTDPETAEREAVVELGDPDRLAAGYADRPPYLIGPAFFPAYVRLLRLLVPIVLPIAAVGGAIGAVVDNGNIGEIIAGSVVALLTAGVHLFFWVTVVFAILDRTGASPNTPGVGWDPSNLPEAPDDSPSRISVPDTVSGLVFVVIGVGLVILQRFRSVFHDASGAIPVLDPGLWSLWIPAFFVLAAAQAIFLVALWRRGPWTYGAAAVQAVLQLVFAAVTCYLLVTGQVFNPDFLDRVPEVGEWGRIVVVITVASIAATSLWGAYDPFRRIHRAKVMKTA